MSDIIDDAPATTTPVPASLVVKPDPPTSVGAGLTATPTGRRRRRGVDAQGNAVWIKSDGTPGGRAGRPPGSRTRRPEDEPIRGQGATITPPPARQPRPSDPVDKDEAKKAEREGKIKAWEDKITGEFTEDLLSVVIATTGIPAALIFKEGHAPVRFAENPHLTPIGQAFAIPGDVAHYWSKLVVALSETETGKKLTGEATGGNLGLIFATLMALGSTIRWGQQVKGAMDQLREFAEQQAQMTQQQQEANSV